ncbi:MAG: hypothetical protein QN163_10955 [Armatimonadota bacterium]|nr:hypothetical protein [Armatimonadota bacterium]
MSGDRVLFVTTGALGRRRRAMGRTFTHEGASWLVKGICAVRSDNRDRQLCLLLEVRAPNPGAWIALGDHPKKRGTDP